MNRRRLLTTVATSTAAFAGCITGSGDETRRVSTDSEICKQPTDDHPPEIVFILTNESDDPITDTTDTHVRADVASTRTNGC